MRGGKIMPMSQEFKNVLFPALQKIIQHYGTPFHILYEKGIRQTIHELHMAFCDAPGGYSNYFAVKANNDNAILRIMEDMGCGFDVSSESELVQVRSELEVGGDKIMLTSNNTPKNLLRLALEAGCILNLDDITFIDKVPGTPKHICF